MVFSQKAGICESSVLQKVPENGPFLTCVDTNGPSRGGIMGWLAGRLEGVEGRGMGVQITKRTQFFRKKANESA